MHVGPSGLVNNGQTRRAVHDVQDLIRQLLERDPAKRLGAEEIKAHPFYEEINWVRPRTVPTHFISLRLGRVFLGFNT